MVRYVNGDLRGVEVRAVHVGSDSLVPAQQLRSLHILHRILVGAIRTATLGERARLGMARISRAGLENRTRGLMHVLNRVNNVGRVGEWRQSQMISLRNITVEFLIEIIQAIAASNDVLRVTDLVWTFYFDDRTFIEGGARDGPLKPPRWVPTRVYPATWAVHGVNCAAFALAYALSTRNQRRSIEPIIVRATALAAQLGWGEATTSTFELGAFVDAYPAYRLILVLPMARNLREYTYAGTEYTPGDTDHLVLMAWDPDQNHYGLVESVTETYRRIHKTREISFCSDCSVLHNNSKACGCDDAEVPVPRKRPKDKCKTCGMYGCTRGCAAQCGMCRAFKEPAHRCIVYEKPADPPLFWQEGDEEVEPGGDARKAPFKLYAYDIEAQIEQSEELIDSLGFGMTPDGSAFEREEGGGGAVRVFRVARGRHIPVMVIFRNVFDPASEQVMTGPDCLRDFVTLMLNTNGGRNICVAHNGSGYDSRHIAEVAAELGGNVGLEVVPRGLKFMRLKVGSCIFADSLLHLPGSLANLAKGYFGNGVMAKGYFPHLFNTAAHHGYRGPIPAKRYFDLAFMVRSEEAAVEFNEWHDSWAGREWDFDAELLKYCRNDVDILARLMKEYHAICIDKFSNLSPWFSTTGPSYVHKAVKIRLSRQLELPDPSGDRDEYREAVRRAAWETHWGVLVSNEYWFARAALRGGRTDVRTLLHTITPAEWARGVRIRYQDIVSMYPYVQIARDYPIGLPSVCVYTLDLYPCYVHRNPAGGGNYVAPICDCGIDEKVRRRDRRLDVTWCGSHVPSVQEILDDDGFFGIVCASLTPPRDLFHPVLVTWDEGAGKCIGSLEPIVRGVFTSVEFKLALCRGYRLDALHRLDRYASAPGLWNDFIKELYIDKMAASEPAPTGAAADELVAQYDAPPFCMGTEVRASFGRWGNFPAKRQVAKTLCNCGWGKHCEQCNKDNLEFIGEGDEAGAAALQNMYANVREGSIRIKDMTVMGARTMIRSSGTGTCEPSFHGGYLPAGLFVPAYGRLMLYEQLEQLGERALYHDTDSIIYVYDPLLYNIPESNVWGGWSVEKFDTANGGIREFVGLGPKSYGLKAENGANFIKVKGLSLKLAHEPLLNFDIMKGLVEEWLGARRITSIGIPQFTFVYRPGEGLSTVHQLKQLCFQPAALKGQLRDDGRLMPFGYALEEEEEEEAAAGEED